MQSWDSWPLGNLTIPRLQEAVFFRPPDLKQAASSCVLTVSCGMAKSFSCAASKNAQKGQLSGIFEDFPCSLTSALETMHHHGITG